MKIIRLDGCPSLRWLFEKVRLRLKINPLDAPAPTPRDTRRDPNYRASHASVTFPSQPNSQTSAERHQTSKRPNIHFRSPMCTAGLSGSTCSSPSDKEPWSIPQSCCISRQNIVGCRVAQLPKAKAHLLVARCTLYPPHIGYLAQTSVLWSSIWMCHIAKPFAVSITHQVAYMSCDKATQPAGQSSGPGINSLSNSVFPWHFSAVKDLNGHVSRR